MISQKNVVSKEVEDFIHLIELNTDVYISLLSSDSYCNEDDNVKYVITWQSGGVSGGSCWDEGTEDNHYSISGEPKPNESIEKVNKFIVTCLLGENVTYTKAVDVLKQLWSEEQKYEENEYYGNYTEYAYIELNTDYLEALIKKSTVYKA